MREVFIVTHLFDDCKDETYIGVYTNFWLSLSELIADFRKNNEDGVERLRILEPSTSVDRRLWAEVTYDGVCEGIYYVIDKVELKGE